MCHDDQEHTQQLRSQGTCGATTAHAAHAHVWRAAATHATQACAVRPSVLMTPPHLHVAEEHDALVQHHLNVILRHAL